MRLAYLSLKSKRAGQNLRGQRKVVQVAQTQPHLEKAHPNCGLVFGPTPLGLHRALRGFHSLFHMEMELDTFA